MSIYTYPQSKAIDEVTFKKSEKGGIHAYIHARTELDATTITSIINTLRGLGWQCIPSTLDGKPQLEVREFGHEKRLLAALEEWVTGEARIQDTQDDNISFKEKFKKRSLQASGVAMAIADLGFIKYGWEESKLHKMINPGHRRDLRDALAGFSYLTGSTIFTLYGRNDQSDVQIREVAKGMLQYAKEKGLNIPSDSALSTTDKKDSKGIFKRVDALFQAYPSEIGNMAYFAAGSLIAWSALQNRAFGKTRPGMTKKQIHEMHKGGWGDTLLGSTTMVSALIGIFGKEKAHDPDAPIKKGWAKMWDYLASNPLSIAGIGYMGSTLCHAFTTYSETKEARRVARDLTAPHSERIFAEFKKGAMPWRCLFIISTIIGEILLTISSKGHGQGVVSDNSVDKSIIALTAGLIAKQPVSRQNILIEEMANFLGRSDVLATKNEEVTNLLRAEVEAMRRNPWALASGPLPEKSLPAVHPAKLPAWQAKVAAETASREPQLSA